MGDADVIAAQLHVWNKVYYNKHVSIRSYNTNNTEYLIFKSAYLLPGFPYTIEFEGVDSTFRCTLRSNPPHNFMLDNFIELITYDHNLDLWMLGSIK